jgi:SAM-dependent methyltransferase
MLWRLARMWPEALEEFMVRLVERRIGKLSPEDGLRFLLRLDGKLYNLQGRSAVTYGGGLHTKHCHTRYHDFFVNRIGPDDRVLDVGCGNGALAKDIAERCGAEVVGIDLNEDNIRVAREQYAQPRVNYVEGDATRFGRSLGLGPETLDIKPLIRHTVGEGGTPNLPSTTNNQQPLTSSPHFQSPIPNETEFTVVVLSNVLEHIDDRVGFLKRLQVYFTSVKTEHREPNTLPQSLVTRHSSPARRFLIRVPLCERNWRVPLKQELGVARNRVHA